MSSSVVHWYQRLPWLSGLILVVVFAWLMYVDLDTHQVNWQEQLQWQEESQDKLLKVTARDLTQQAMLLAQLVARDHALVAEIREAHQIYSRELAQGGGAAETANKRLQVKQRLDTYWVDMKELGISQINVFFSPGAVSFLRIQRPNRYNDSLSGLRPLLMGVFSSGIPAWGLDITREGSGYSAVVPIFADDTDQGPVIAVLELTIASLYTPILEDNAIDMALFLRKSVMEPLIWDEVLKKIRQQSHVTLDDWRLEQTSSPLVLEWWERGQMPVGRTSRVLSSQDGKHYLVSWFPLESVDAQASTRPVAAAVWKDISANYLAYQSGWRRIIGKWIVVLLVTELLLLGFLRLSRRYVDLLVRQHTEQLNREKTLAEQSRQRLALALRSSESGFWEWDIVKDIASFSPEWRSIYGIPPASPTSTDLDEWMSRIHPADKRASYNIIVSHLKGETPMFENEYRLQTSDGNYKWIFTRGKVVEWQPDGRAAVMLGVYTDITQRKNMELIAVRQQAALHALNEIASLPVIDSDELLHQALELAVRYLGVETGAISEIRQGSCQTRIYFALDDVDVPNLNEPLSQTYCSLTVAARDLVAEDNIPHSAFADHAAYRRTHIESYIGTPLWIKGELYGTLHFNARKSRHQEYDRLDKDFVRLLGRWVCSVVERWQQDEEKKILLDRFHKLSERLPGFLYQYQLRPDGTSFFPYASPGIKNIYNATPEEVSSSAEKIFAVIHPDDVGWVSETVSYSATHLTPWVATVRINNPERGLIWTHIQSIPERLEDGSVLWNGYVSDITAIKQTELELEQINALNQAIFDAANIAIISTDVNGIIKTFNRGAEQLLGYNATEMIDKRPLAIVHVPEEMELHAQRLTRELGYEITSGFDVFVARAREGSVDENEWHYARKDGSRIPVLLTVSALRDYRGEIFGYLGIARDISELKRIDKMKSEFISTVSHELRTPLTAISGALGILTGGAMGNLPDAAVRMLQIAYNNAQRLIHLVNDLLDMEKLVAGKMHFEFKPQALLPLVQQSLEANAAYAAQYKVNFELHSEGEEAIVMVDSLRLEQVLTNYLSNAAKFSPPDETVIVHVERRFGHVRVTVADKGKGIPEEFRTRIFQKFSQADSSDTRQKGGTGLGLAICKELIERMGGKVGFDSLPGQGAAFYFELPCEDLTQKRPFSQVEPERPHRRLLIVEDDASIAAVWVSLLQNAGYECDLAPTGKIAQEYLALRHYDLMTLDLQLPDMDGLEIVCQMRREELLQESSSKKSLQTHLPVLIVSVTVDMGRQRYPKDLPQEHIRWLQKPLDNRDLLNHVAELLGDEVQQ